MFLKGRVSKLVAISAFAMVPALIGLFWAVSTNFSFAGETRAPRAYTYAYTTAGHGVFLGVELEEETEYSEGGARINRVVDDSAAAEAGLEKNDIIVAFDGHTIRGPKALTQQLHEREPGDTVEITVVRDGREQSFDVELGERSGLAALSTGEGSFSVVAPDMNLFGCDEDDDDCDFSVFAPGAGVFGCDDDDEDCEGFTLDLSHFGLGGRPVLGVQLVSITDELREHMGAEEGTGVLVSKVLSGMPAEDAGIEVGDLIVGVNGEEIEHHGEISKALRGLQGQTFEVEVIRDGRSMSIDVTIPEPDDSRPTGPRAFYFAPHLDLEGLDIQLDEVREQVRDVLEQSRETYDRVLRQVSASQLDSMSEARRAYGDALRQSRKTQHETSREVRKQLQKTLDLRNSI
jgi:membrane-associated protease RseP (regulator of RpoE activity)